MTPEEQKRLEDTLAQQVVGRQPEIDKIMQSLTRSPLKRSKQTASVILSGSPGTGKTEMYNRIADRFKEVIPFAPLSPAGMKQLVADWVEKEKKLPENRKEEAAGIIGELIDQGAYDVNRGLRSLRQTVAAIADVSGEPDMREALHRKYPAILLPVSLKSGEKLAEAFTNGTSARAGVRKPVKLKSRRVGFFTLN